MTLAETVMANRKREVIREIARAALELFLADGFAATSVEAIAAAAGCSPRTFYRYFGTKEDVAFYDLPLEMEHLRSAVGEHLATGLEPWPSVCQALTTIIGRFDGGDQRLPALRLELWLNEPPLRARYLHYMNLAEHAISDCLHEHRGTTPDRDELPQLIAVCAVGAYRSVIVTHRPSPSNKLAEHLGAALEAIGTGLGEPKHRRGRRRQESG